MVVLINGIKCRALLDSGAGSSYISSTIAKLLRKPPVRKETKRIEMMMDSTTRNIEIYKETIESLSRTFTMEVEFSKVERKIVLTLENPHYSRLIEKYQHFKDRDVTSMMLTRNSMCDHDHLCRLDVLGIEDSPIGDQMYIYQEFQDQLKRKADGSYETSLLWKPGHPSLHNNKNGSLSRLRSLIRKHRNQLKEFEQYDQIVQTQLS